MQFLRGVQYFSKKNAKALKYNCLEKKKSCPFRDSVENPWALWLILILSI